MLREVTVKIELKQDEEEEGIVVEALLYSGTTVNHEGLNIIEVNLFYRRHKEKNNRSRSRKNKNKKEKKEEV